MSKSTVAKTEMKDYSRIFERLGGIVFSRNGSAEAVGEECPFCSRNKFYVNMGTGQYNCKHCGKSGNVVQYLTWQHRRWLAETTPDHYRVLKDKRGIGLQTLRRHELAFDADQKLWYIPSKNSKGNVVNIQLYDPTSGQKYNLPALSTSLYGLQHLSTDHKKILFLCEGAFDAIALDYHFGMKRGKYDIVATPGTLKEDWIEVFRGRKVRALYDNDKGGDAHRERVRKLIGESRVAAELRLLKWPEGFPDGCDINDLVKDHPEIPLIGWTLDNSVKVTAEPKLIIRHGRDRKLSEPKPIDWPWPDHLRCGTYVSFSGVQGSLKSTIAGEIVARYTRGLPMYGCTKAGMPAGHVLYIHAEDDEEAMWERLEVAGADLDKISLMPATLKDGDPMNVLNHLEEMEQLIREYDIQLVIIDGQNSVVGAPDISTDMKGRFNVTNKLHQYAQRLNLCLIGIRNEDPTGRAMGSQSMGDMGRCVLRTEKVAEGYYQLIFVKVSDTSPKNYPPIPYSVKDCGGSRRKILWGKGVKDAIKAGVEKRRAGQ